MKRSSRWAALRVLVPTMTEHIPRARLLPPGTLPGDFFAAPRFSLPDRAPALYRWLHDVLPWHP